ncbi:MarR family transcriptional regulator [Allobranchiibius sp. CTAmp26]|uniref:MarR family winged helix-turn-helix transcriptional regulator n=1 Tax=Allobranchiibius sp. CTAmp26 TaxID=2815214 RepID=UPI001AA11E92|nr:MarR family transcriptional regulator [Allobranchiibius sp. CTAmp26]MBO1754378.1 MarR family transcriptional regulator [Allobranchiibius sp. CTAmp26]
MQRKRLTRSGNDGQDTEDFVNALLTASRVLVGVSARSLADVEETVTPTQFRVLVVLAGNGDGTLGQLAASLGVNASTAQRQVDRLMHDGLVDRRENPQDRREVAITLTQHGSRLVDVVTSRRRVAIAQIVQDMQDTDRRALIAALEAFATAAGEPTARPDHALRLGW